MKDTEIDRAQVDRAVLAMLAPAVRKSFYTSVLSIAIFSALLYRFSPDGILAWLGLRVVASIAGLVIIGRVIAGHYATRASVTMVVTVLATSGVVWGLIPLFVRPDAPQWQAIVVLWLFGNQSVITTACSSSPRAFHWAMGSVTLVGAACLALAGNAFGAVLAGLLLLGGVYSVSMFVPMHRAVRGAIEGQLRTEALAARLGERQTELQRANDALAELASKDVLTGLLNRRTFVAEVSDSAGRIMSSGHIGYIDLDDFKPVNDSLGHAAGDVVLVEVARRWQHVLPDAALLSRMGGDEFAFFWPDLEPESKPESVSGDQIVERLTWALDPPVQIDGSTHMAMTASIGVRAVSSGDDLTQAIADADAALYTIKVARKSQNETPSVYSRTEGTVTHQ